jgi:hypothetical protein
MEGRDPGGERQVPEGRSMSTVRASTYQDASGGSNAVFSGVASPPNSMGFRNRIINGDMRIDQRNAGASVSFNTSSNFPVDRFKTYNTVGSGSTAQRSTTAPAGFNNSILFTVGTGASPGAADECRFFQPIEGFNVADLGFGTANAQTVTISFRVRSSITGTYALNLRNDAGNRSYVATYTIDAANTWETKTVTIAGDTSGTWTTDNSTGIMLRFDLGSGSNANTTAGAWQAGNFGRTSACVNWIATSGATFYITGVQLEAGTVASPFERIDYGRQLMMCQRYYWQTGKDNTFSIFGAGVCSSTTTFYACVPLKQTMRGVPTLATSGTASHYQILAISGTALSVVPVLDTVNMTVDTAFITCTVSSGLTAGQGGLLRANSTTSAYLGFSSEL